MTFARTRSQRPTAGTRIGARPEIVLRGRGHFSLIGVLTAFMALGAAHGCGVDATDDAPTDPDGGPIGEETTGPDGDPHSGDSNAGDSGVIGVESGTLAPDYVDFDINHVLITGQSNAVSNGGSPPITAAQPYKNLMFDTGVMPMAQCEDGNGCKAYQTPAAFVPLVEGDKFFDYQVETSSSGFGNGISHLAKDELEFGTRPGYPLKHDVLVSDHGRSGNTYFCLRKSFCQYNIDRGHLSPFAQGMMEVQSAKALAAAAGRTYVVRAVAAIHGESDHYAYVAAGGHPEFPMASSDGTAAKIKDYTDALVEWQQDYETSVRAITGQKLPIPLFISAVSGWTSTRTSVIPQMQLDAHVRAPGKVVYVTPAYPLTVRSDCLHFDQDGYRRLGEYFAKVYARVVFSGQRWEPVRPREITRVGNVITVKFYVPVPPLSFDVVKVLDPGNFGFDVLDAGNLVGSAAAIAGPDTVTITLAAAPTGALRLRYAQNEPSPGCIGPGTQGFGGGARGNLRDADNTSSLYGYDLHNWAVNFDAAVP